MLTAGTDLREVRKPVLAVRTELLDALHARQCLAHAAAACGLHLWSD